jgi:hypothetical protein
VNTGFELLRVIPLVCVFIRRFLPPNLTEKERERASFGIRALGDPGYFGHANTLAQIVSNDASR